MHTLSNRFALRGRPAEGARRLGGALAVSIVAHLALLSWQASLPGTGGRSFELSSAAPKSLSVSLRTESEGRPEEPVEVEVPPPPLEQAPLPLAGAGNPKDSPQAGQGEADSMPLVGYFPSDRLTKMPEAVGIFDVKPPPGGDTGLAGKVTIRIWIGANGGIDRVRVLDSGLPQAYADAALAAFERLRFKPGEIGGVPVRSWVEVVIEYADFRDAIDAPATNK